MVCVVVVMVRTVVVETVRSLVVVTVVVTVTPPYLQVWCNLMSWAAVAAPDYSQATPSLPLAGGAATVCQGGTVYTVATHPTVLR